MSRTCQECGADLKEGQDWCLQCGAAAPGSLQTGGPGWRSATVVLGATAALVLGAAAAAYAALSQSSPRRPAPKVVTIAQAPATASIPTTPSTPALPTPTTSSPPTTSTPPKIPLTAPAPKSSKTTTTTKTTAGKGKSPGQTKKNESATNPGGSSGEPPTPIMLDTNAASTYNPDGYPASSFGDPSLAIDEETSTGWTAQVEPSIAPRMAAGLAIDLRTPRRLGALTLITSTPGMTVQAYGSQAAALPKSITAHAWVKLGPLRHVKKRKTHMTLRHAGKRFRFLVLWINRAPASSVGTPSAPGHVSVNELELFPAK